MMRQCIARGIYSLILVGVLCGCVYDAGTDAANLPPATESAERTPPQQATAIVQYNEIHQPVISQYGMVVSQNELASQIGRRILARGGNATDAAVATAFALAVTLPRAGNLGGSGFLLHRSADGGEVIALDFRSAAPNEFKPDQFLDADGRVDSDQFEFGAIAAGVPGTVAGLWDIWQRSGSLEWRALVAPAQELAEQGITVSYDLAYALNAAQPLLSQFSGSRESYLDNAGQAYQFGDVFKQPNLAWSLGEIAEQGADALYRGRLGEMIVASVQAAGGVLSMADLAAYRVRQRAPLETKYRGHRVYSMPPVSGGGLTLLQMLSILSEFDVSALRAGSAEHLHLLAEVMKIGAANRRYGIGDPDFVDVDVEGRLSVEQVQRLAEQISLTEARSVEDIHPVSKSMPESRDTTHLSVVDRWGNAVSLTYTLGYSFGSGFVADGTGILLDNQMKNFYYNVPGHANAFAPGKRMMSTMTPTIVENPERELLLVTGTPGGSRIINAILQVLVNVIDFDMDIAVATHAPRIHHNWSEPRHTKDTEWAAPTLQVEAGVSVDTQRLLEAKGHHVTLTQTIGSTQSIMCKDGFQFGAADPRRPDAAAEGIVVLENGVPE